jgi:hypothetical protein
LVQAFLKKWWVETRNTDNIGYTRKINTTEYVVDTTIYKHTQIMRFKIIG